MSKLVPIAIEVTAGGEDFKVLPFGYGMQVVFSARLATLLGGMGLKPGDTVDFSTIMSHGADLVMDMTAAAVGKPRSWLDTLPDFEEGMALSEAVWNANAEVFLKKVLPAVVQKLAALSAKNKPVAPSPSKTSSRASSRRASSATKKA